MKRTFEIEFSDDLGRLWMNRDNLLLCLTSYCPNTKFTVKDVTGDGQCDPTPHTVEPDLGRNERLLSDIRGAVARGWCSKENEKKSMDVELAEAIAKEVIGVVNLA